MNETDILQACYVLICREKQRVEHERDGIQKVIGTTTANVTITTHGLQQLDNDIAFLETLRKEVYWWKATGNLLSDKQSPVEKIAYLEKLIIKLADIIAEFVDTDPNVTAGILSEWLDSATDYDPETGWRVNYPSNNKE